jgi:Domain of unknown function (DUF6265)
MTYIIFGILFLSLNLVKVDYTLEDFERLYPLIGEWTTPHKESELVEKWEKKYPKRLQGKTFYIEGTETRVKENILLDFKEGRIYYTPASEGENNKEPAVFTLIEIDKNKFIFENNDLKFSRRIIYELKSNNELNTITGWETGKGFKKTEHKFKRKPVSKVGDEKN